MKKSIVFDSGPVISLATNNLLWTLEPLKLEFEGDFLIPDGVRRELIDRPLQGKRFKFEAMQVLSIVNKGIIRIVQDPEVKKRSLEILDLANSIFNAKGRTLQLVHPAEIEALALAIHMKSSAMVVDERTTRLLVEHPERLRKIMEHKLHTKISIDKKKLSEFSKITKDVKIIRSTEIVAIAFEKGLLDIYLPKIPNPRKELLESALWGVKLNGCSISHKEINKIVKIETKR